MNDRPEGNGHENMCDDRQQNDIQNPVCISTRKGKEEEEEQQRRREMSEIKTDRRSQENITVNRQRKQE